MFYTKSLFVEFCESPHIAWRHVHDKRGVYQQIMDEKYGQMDGRAIGKAAEDAVLQQFDPAQIATVDTQRLDYTHRHQSYADRTQHMIATSPTVIYQPTFVHKRLFCKCDLLVRDNATTGYKLREIKAKNRIRKKTTTTPLLDDLRADISFQHYVLSRACTTYAGATGTMPTIVHMNRDYRKHGTIDYSSLLHYDHLAPDDLMSDREIEEILTQMHHTLALPKEQFDSRYPYAGESHLTYYGTPHTPGSIWTIPRAYDQRTALVDAGITQIDEIDSDTLTTLMTPEHAPTRASRYVTLRQSSTNKNKQQIIDTDAVREQLDGLVYPLFFYDYETVSWPVPLLDGTSPWQHAVVQYSCHRMDEDGSLMHTDGIIDPHATDNSALIDQLINDLHGGDGGTYIVRYKGFENTRNDELAQHYPHHAAALQSINAKTFDLMEIFSELHYFDRRFGGSASLKNVLPVITDISYDDLAIRDGLAASTLLMRLILQTLPPSAIDQTIADLRAYCAQDSYAMVTVYEAVKQTIDNEHNGQTT